MHFLSHLAVVVNYRFIFAFFVLFLPTKKKSLPIRAQSSVKPSKTFNLKVKFLRKPPKTFGLKVPTFAQV